MAADQNTADQTPEEPKTVDSAADEKQRRLAYKEFLKSRRRSTEEKADKAGQTGDAKDASGGGHQKREDAPLNGAPNYKSLIKRTITLSEAKLDEAVEEAMKALTERQAEAKVFQRAGRLMHPIMEKANAASVSGEPGHTMTPAMIDLTCETLEMLLRKNINWQRLRKGRNGELKAVPGGPDRVPKLIMKYRGHWPFSPISGLISTPTLRADGSLISAEGYDEATGIYLMSPPEMPSINLRPSREDALAAAKYIDNGLLQEFPWKDELSLSIGLSGIMTTLMRGAVPFAPIHGINAPEPGSGKTELMNIISVIATGYPCAVIGAAHNRDELYKQTATAMISAYPIICYDNFTGTIDSDLLSQATTSETVIIRLFGLLKNLKVSCRASTIFVDGNNFTVSGDLVRRVLMAQLDAGIERPETRKFKGKPQEEALRNRGRYIAAALTMSLGYLAAGSPDMSLMQFNGFDDWMRLVRSPLVWLGYADPALSVEAVRSNDPKIQNRRQVYRSWVEFVGSGQTTGRTYQGLVDAAIGTLPDRLIGQAATDPKRLAFKAALAVVAPPEKKGQEIDANHLSYWLRACKNKILDGMKLCCEEDKHTHRMLWWIEKV